MTTPWFSPSGLGWMGVIVGAVCFVWFLWEATPGLAPKREEPQDRPAFVGNAVAFSSNRAVAALSLCVASAGAAMIGFFSPF